MNNPYNKETQETMFNNWEAGFAAVDKNDCPYEGDDEENQQFRLVWMKGFNAKQRAERKAKRQAQNAVEATAVVKGISSTAEPTVNHVPKLSDIKTEELMRELANRKQGELVQLKQQREELDKKIAVLEAICGTQQ